MTDFKTVVLGLEGLLKTIFPNAKLRKSYPDFNQDELTENTISLLYHSDGPYTGTAIRPERIGESLTQLDIELHFYLVDEIDLLDYANTVREQLRDQMITISNDVLLDISDNERVPLEPDSPAILNHSFMCRLSLLIKNAQQ